jgi:serine/threonine-protein kinase
MTTMMEARELAKRNDVPTTAGKIGPYLLGREIGRGATGVIYEALHADQGRKVTIKVLDPNIVGVEKASRQDYLFAREAMNLAEIPRHPGIVGILDAGLADGLPYIVTEYLEGQPLSLSLQFRKQDLKALVRILRDVALAMSHSHQHHILHRNLKPSNVILDAAGHPHITDFGAAKRVDPHQHQSTTYTLGGSVGTPAYMSPERAAGLKNVDLRTDVYSMGAILYEMITGRPPFNLGGSVADLVTIVRGEIDAPSKVNPTGRASGADVALEMICMKALSKLPADRQATAKEFADALTWWLGEDQVRKEPAVPSRTTIAGFCLAAGLAAASALAYFVIRG